MRTLLPLAHRILRCGGKTTLLSSGLTFMATVTVTVLLLFTVAANVAFNDRSERTEWRAPEEVSQSEATVIVASHRDFFDQLPVSRIDIAPLENASTDDIPPGLDSVVRPGQVYVSPALAALMAENPESELADRYPGEIVGQIGREGLVHPDELVVVVGHSPDDPAMSMPRIGPDTYGPAFAASFDTGTPAGGYGLYQILMAVATVLMVVPLLIFGAATARLSVERRDQRLATMRLVGATPAQIVGLTVIENVLVAIAGALAGAAMWLAIIPAIARIPIDGGHWFAADLWPGLALFSATVALIPVLVGVAAIAGLRRIVISPLGVARRTSQPRLTVARVAVLAVAVAGFLTVAAMRPGSEMLFGALILGFMAAVLLGFNVAGPWIVQLIGRLFGKFARTPERLLAARRLVADPRSAWRTVAGVALTGFSAGFIALLPIEGIPEDAYGADRLTAFVPSGQAQELAQRVEAESSHAISVTSDDMSGSYAIVTVDISSGNTEAARTELSQITNGAMIEHINDWAVEGQLMNTSIRTGTIVVLAVSFLTAIVSAAIAGMSSVMARREIYHLMHLSGTPLRVLNRARRQETLLPLLIMGLGSIGIGMTLASPFSTAFGTDPIGVAILAITVTVGFAGVILASAASRPLLRSVVTSATIRE
ncbi:FtsX-like permease family protein [Natronoglycomyces albus]|uniref:ABC3 transporter permease C-terminal domain-containing protein n=1 Tax=Natronoglycomyces albus TaxID=2811108 RepID=A0A895XPK4_9ACTN|nr:FtsX-like permease family protein [Natronoglycomyces albus]QSB04456.1 hypothetical protein JQS30_11760 [Natronoglycomyces albus]